MISVGVFQRGKLRVDRVLRRATRKPKGAPCSDLDTHRDDSCAGKGDLKVIPQIEAACAAGGITVVEQWIKEGTYALHWTRLSGKRFVCNQVRLGLFVLAYNLGNFLRRLVLPRKIKHGSLRSLLAKLIKIGAKVVRHSGYITFQMAEVTIDQKLFGEILSRIKRLRYPAV